MEPNPLTERICSDPELLRYLPAVEIQGLMDVSGHLGDSPERARQFATTLREELQLL